MCSRTWDIPFFLTPMGLFHQVMVLAELFLEMLQRDFGYRIYKMLLSLPEKVVAPPEPEKEEVAKEEEAVKEEGAKESKEEVQNEGTAAESDTPLVSTSAPCVGTGTTHSNAEENECCVVPGAVLSTYSLSEPLSLMCSSLVCNGCRVLGPCMGPMASECCAAVSKGKGSVVVGG